MWLMFSSQLSQHMQDCHIMILYIYIACSWSSFAMPSVQWYLYPPTHPEGKAGVVPGEAMMAPVPVAVWLLERLEHWRLSQ